MSPDILRDYRKSTSGLLLVSCAADRMTEVKINYDVGGNRSERSNQKWLVSANGDPYGNRTRASAVKGPRPNR